MAGQLGSLDGLVRLSPGLNQQLVLSLLPPPLPLPPRDTAGFMQKSRNVSVGCHYAPN